MSLQIEIALKKANKFLKQGLIIKADNEVKNVLSKYPNNLRAMNFNSHLNNIKEKHEDSNFSKEKLKDLLIIFKNKEYKNLLQILPKLFKQNPNEFILRYLFGLCHANLNNHDQAILNYQKALELKPNNHEIYNHLGLSHKAISKLDSAINFFRISIDLKSDYCDPIINLANILKDKKEFDNALDLYNKSLTLTNDRKWIIIYNIGLIYENKNCFEEAIKNFKISINLNSKFVDSHISLADCFFKLGKKNSAFQHYKDAQSINENYYRLWNSLGLFYKGNGEVDKSIECFKKSIALNSKSFQSYYNIANAFSIKKEYSKSVYYYDQAIKINNNYHDAIAQKIYRHSLLFDWEIIEKHSDIIPNLGMNEFSVDPFSLIFIEDSPEREQKRAVNFGKKFFYIDRKFIKNNNKSKKIKIGYFSNNFKIHPEMLLLIGVLEKHNKDKFEIIVYSYGSNIEDKMTKRIRKAVNKFHEVRSLNDNEILEITKKDELDIGIHLNGYTDNSRTELFAKRVAPIQINFLGYPATLGVDFIDYIIADKTVIPDEFKTYYTEKVINLPDTYLPTDNNRKISKKIMKRSEFGLPENAFVLCCFHQNAKISKQNFESWLRILKKNSNTVLWLKTLDVVAKKNLLNFVSQHNINKKRIIFAPRLIMEEYLGSYQLADIFLDTFNFNGHTTVSEALWAGLPVITKIGKSFTARVAASLLNAIDAPELITKTENDYENLIIELSNNKEKLEKIKNKIKNNILTHPLFNTDLYTRNLETALTKVYFDSNHLNLQTINLPSSA
jgi:protein O-GlcNAc transferase